MPGVVYARSVRMRRARPSVASFTALRTRARIGSRIGYPTSRYNRSYRYGGVAPRRNQLYGRGIAGSQRTVFARGVPGREVPLYLPGTGVLTEAHAGDISTSVYAVDATATNVVHLNPIALGDGLADRHANRVTMTQLQIRGAVTAGASGVIGQGCLMIVYDRQPQGALPVLTDILDTANVNSFQSLTTRDRFEILWRYDYVVEGSAAAPTADAGRRVDKTILMRKQAAYTVGTSSGAIANVRTGGLYFVFVGSGIAGSTATNATLGFRLVFSP